MKLNKFFVIMLLMFSKIYSQENKENCKVLMSTISQNYNGECFNGLANGKGEAKGVDSFIGYFKDGLPNGRGKYVFQNGSLFEGNWNFGKKEGEGKFTFYISGKKKVQKGFWLNDEYFGNTDPKEFFVIKNKTNIPYYNFTRIEEEKNKLIFSIIINNLKFVPDNFVLKTSSGITLNGLKEIIISDFRMPFHCEVEYTVRKYGVNVNCGFTFDINKPGSYELQLVNE